jgi:hypothetical protein
VRVSRWLIVLPAVVLSLFAQPVKANLLGDWTYSQSRDCGGSVEVVDNSIILHGADNQVEGFGMCGGQANWVKVETVIPAGVNTVDFSWGYSTNDGWVYDPPQYGINGVYTLITQNNNATGDMSVPVEEGDVFTFRQYSIDTCCQPGHLTISNLSLWQFTSTTSSSTTTDVTTTTVDVSTTVVSSTSSVPQTTSTESTTTTLQPSTTQASTTTTSTTTTSTVPQTTTTTEPPSPPPAQPPATVEPPPTTMPAPPDTEPTPPETQPTPPETAPQPPETNPTYLPAVTLPLVEVTSPPDAPQAPETLPIPDTAPPPPQTAPAPPDVKEALTVEQFDAVIEQLSEATEEQIVALVDDLITKDLDTSQAAAFVSSPEVLAAISSVQAEALFSEISTDELSVEQAAEVVAAVQDAPAEVREAFESVLNIFSGFADTYVPVDSRIPVSERRALVALGAVLLAASPAPTLRRRQ